MSSGSVTLDASTIRSTTTSGERTKSADVALGDLAAKLVNEVIVNPDVHKRAGCRARDAT